jgi:hypothetical protein
MSHALSDTNPEEFARNLRSCLDATNPIEALIAFAPEVHRTADLPRVAGQYNTLVPHPLTGIAMMLVSGALQCADRGRDIVPFLNEIADLFAPPYRLYRPGSNLSDILFRFPFLNVPLIKRALADKEQDNAVSIVNRYDNGKDTKLNWIFEDDVVAGILSHSRTKDFGPFHYDRAWVLEKQEVTRALGPLDGHRQRVVDFDQLFLENALMVEQPERGLPILGPDGQPDDTFLGRAHLERLGFNAVCLLAALGRNDDALALARHMIRRGYDQQWRFILKSAAEMPWTQKMRQNDWLAAISETLEYKTFLETHVKWTQLNPDDPVQTAICSVREGTWGGKKKTKCFISRNPIMPGDPVIRIRRMHGVSGYDDFDIASVNGVAKSSWKAAVDNFKNNAVPLKVMFGPAHNCGVRWDDPDISAFHYDSVLDPENVDIKRAVAIVSACNPPPIRRMWTKGPERTDRYHLAFDPWAGDRCHGEPLTLIWMLIKSGYRDQILSETVQLIPAAADKVFAMLATFDDPMLRSAAAKYFAIPELPATMELVFSSRLTLEQHIQIADFGRAHPRYRAGIAAAMQSYALHIYSNSAPTANWFLMGLEHFIMAHGCRLLLLFVNHPEDDDVLPEMIKTGWLPDGVSSGAYDAYSNTAHFYYRAVSMHIARDAPERFSVWMDRPWIKDRLKMAVDRETFRMLEMIGKPPRKTVKNKKA